MKKQREKPPERQKYRQLTTPHENTEAQTSTQSNTKTNTPIKPQITKLNNPSILDVNCTLKIENFQPQDIQYIHRLINTKLIPCNFFEKTKSLRLYYFSKPSHTHTILKSLERQKMSNTIAYQIHDEIDRQGSEGESETRSPSQSLYSGTETEVDFSSEEEEGEWRKQTPIRKKKDKIPNTDTAITTTRNTKEPNPNTTNNTKESTQGNIIKILNHINKGGNPIFLKAICNQHNVQMPCTHYHGFKTKISTLIFETHTLAHKFIQTINPNSFGPKAHYQIVPNKKTTDTPRDTTQDWNAVIKGVDPEITEEEFATELDSHNISFRKILRIIAPTGERTHLVRIFFPDKDSTAKAIFNGITLLGRRYRVEAPREEARHLPCKNCAQYGHAKLQCPNPPACLKCGGDPNKCQNTHQNTQIFCATCKQTGHYTGQVRCPLYPRNTHPPVLNKYTPLTRQQNENSPTKPSQTDFPPLRPAWVQPTPKTDTQLNTDTQNNLAGEKTNKPQNQTTNTPSNMTPQLDTCLNNLFQTAITKLEQYIDKKIEILQDQIIKFTIALIDNTYKPKDRKTLQTITNSTSKKLWKKQVKIVPLKNTIDVMINKMKQGLREELTAAVVQHTATPDHT